MIQKQNGRRASDSKTKVSKYITGHPLFEKYLTRQNLSGDRLSWRTTFRTCGTYKFVTTTTYVHAKFLLTCQTFLTLNEWTIPCMYNNNSFFLFNFSRKLVLDNFVIHKKFACFKNARRHLVSWSYAVKKNDIHLQTLFFLFL